MAGYPTSGAASTGIGGFGSGGTHGAGNIITMEFLGMAKLMAKFKQYKAGVVIGGALIAHEVAEDIAAAAEDFAPFDPENSTEPHVRDSIHTRRRGKGAEVFVNRGGVRDEVPAYLEFGTYKMAARPFLKPAAELVINSYGLKRASRKVGGLLGPTGIRHTG